MRIEPALNGQKLLYLFIEEGVNFLSQFIVYGFALDEVIDSLREVKSCANDVHLPTLVV